MAGYSGGYTRHSVNDVDVQAVSITSVDLGNNIAGGMTKNRTAISIDISHHVGAIQVTPAIGDQWYVEKYRGSYRLKSQIPYNNIATTVDPTQGQVQLGSGAGPVHLHGTAINVNGPLRLSAGNSPLPEATTVDPGSLMYDGTRPVFSNGISWIPLTTGSAGDYYVLPLGGIPSTDMTSAVRSTLGLADTAYQLPGTGVPITDLASAAQTDLSLAATALQFIAANSIGISQLSATGAPGSLTFLRGDNTWAAPPGSAGALTMNITAATTLTLTSDYQVYVFTGSSAATWTLPPVSGNGSVFFYLDNRGSANIRLVPAGSNHIWHHASVSSLVIAPGGSYQIIDDGTYWNGISAATVTDSQWWMTNTTDTTKLAQFDCSGIATGTTRTYTLPDTSDTLVTLAATQTLAGKTLADSIFGGYTEQVVVLGTVGSLFTLSISSGTILTATLTASTACTFTMPTATPGKSFVLLLRQDSSTGLGSATFTGVKWSAASAPVITTTAGKMDILTFFSDGVNWYGAYSQDYAT